MIRKSFSLAPNLFDFNESDQSKLNSSLYYSKIQADINDKNRRDLDNEMKKIDKKLVATTVSSGESMSNCIEKEPPNVSDKDADQELEHRLWVEREISRLRNEARHFAEVAYENLQNEMYKQLPIEKRLELHEMNKKPREKMKFMQKYYHKGAFRVDDSERAKELMDNRNHLAATGDDLYDKTLVHDRFVVRGDDYLKKGRSKHTHLANEDTTTSEQRKIDRMINSKLFDTDDVPKRARKLRSDEDK